MSKKKTINLKIKKYTEGIQDFSTVIRLDSLNGSAYINRGLCYYNLKDSIHSCQDWKKATQFQLKKAEEFLTKHCR